MAATSGPTRAPGSFSRVLTASGSSVSPCLCSCRACTMHETVLLH